MQHLARWHIWLGWAAALPLILWTVSGLFMTLRPIEEVRGGDLRRPPALLQTANLNAPRLAAPVKRLALTEQHGASVWVVTDKTGLQAITHFAADAAPLDLRKERPSWQAAFSDGTHVYIDAETGEVLALRSSYWRAYDFMWGLHIMDPVGREDSSHVLLWLFAAVALVSCLLGAPLLFRRRRRLS
jgi:hypothetical protein